MKKVLIPVDESGLDPATLGFAKELVEKMGAQLHVVTVIPYADRIPYAPLTHYTDLGEKAFASVSEDVITKAVKQLADVGVANVNVAIMRGDPASEIIDCADKEQCDLILIHTHGMGVVKRFTIGSVTSKVIHHANVPVFVVK